MCGLCFWYVDVGCFVCCIVLFLDSALCFCCLLCGRVAGVGFAVVVFASWLFAVLLLMCGVASLVLCCFCFVCFVMFDVWLLVWLLYVVLL